MDKANGEKSRPKPFVYEPLPPDHIRLIQLWGYPIDAYPETINARFETHPINDLPEFDAISYAWGQDEATETVKCINNYSDEFRQVNVTPHLWTGMASIIHKAPSVLCWIDFLSINQDDVEEKQRQIPLMTTIYSQATNVVIWLGEPEIYWHRDLFLPEFLALATMALAMIPEGDPIPLEIVADPAWQAFGEAFRAFERLSWFCRSWVCQEAILAKNIAVLYGLNILPWDALDQLSKLITSTGFEALLVIQPSDNNPDTMNDRFNSMSSINELRSYRTGSPRNIRTDRLIQLIRHTSATKPVDKVYCILGLLDPEISKQIVVDYTIPYEQVWLKFAQAVVIRDPSLGLLAHSYRQPQNTDPSKRLPSWCPDLTSSADDIFDFLSFEYFAGFIGPDSDKWPTCSCQATLLPSGRQIRVPGFRLGTVVEVAPPRPDMGVPSDDNSAMLTAISATMAAVVPWLHDVEALVHRALDPLSLTSAQIHHALWNVLIAGVANTHYSNHPDDPNEFLADNTRAFYPACELMGEGFDLWRVLMETTQFANVYQDVAGGGMDALAKLIAFWTERGWGKRQVTLFQAWSRELAGFGRRRIIRTEEGRVGVGPWDVQVGDMACVLLGAGPIFVLRKGTGKIDGVDGEWWTTVGDGYVYGCMTLEDTDSTLRAREEDFIIG